MFKVSCVSSVFSSWSVSTSPRQYSRIVPALDHWHLLSRDYVLIYSCIFRAWASLVAQLVKNPPQCRRPGFNPWVGKIPWRRARPPTLVFWPGEFSPWGDKESDTTERLSLSLTLLSISKMFNSFVFCLSHNF